MDLLSSTCLDERMKCFNFWSQGCFSSGISDQMFVGNGNMAWISHGCFGSEHGVTLFLVEVNALDCGCLQEDCEEVIFYLILLYHHLNWQSEKMCVALKWSTWRSNNKSLKLLNWTWTFPPAFSKTQDITLIVEYLYYRIIVIVIVDESLLNTKVSIFSSPMLE